MVLWLRDNQHRPNMLFYFELKVKLNVVNENKPLVVCRSEGYNRNVLLFIFEGISVLRKKM